MDIINKDILDDKKLLDECVVSFEDLLKCRRTDSWYYYMIKKYADKCNIRDVVKYVDAIYINRKHESDSYLIALTMDRPKKPKDRNTTKALIFNSTHDISNLLEPSDDWVTITNKNAAYAIYAPIEIQRNLLKIAAVAPIKVFRNMVKADVCTELFAILVERNSDIITAVINWHCHDVKLSKLSYASSSFIRKENVDKYQLANMLDMSEISHHIVAEQCGLLDMVKIPVDFEKEAENLNKMSRGVYDITRFDKISTINYVDAACAAALEANPDNIKYVRCKNSYIYVQFVKKYPHKIHDIVALPYKSAAELIECGYADVPVVRKHIVDYLSEIPEMVSKFDLTYDECRRLLNLQPSLIKYFYETKHAYFVKYIEEYYTRNKISLMDDGLVNAITNAELIYEVIKINDKFIQLFYVPDEYIKKPEHLYLFDTDLNNQDYIHRYDLNETFDWIVNHLDDVIATQKRCAL